MPQCNPYNPHEPLNKTTYHTTRERSYSKLPTMNSDVVFVTVTGFITVPAPSWQTDPPDFIISGRPSIPLSSLASFETPSQNIPGNATPSNTGIPGLPSDWPAPTQVIRGNGTSSSMKNSPDDMIAKLVLTTFILFIIFFLVLLGTLMLYWWQGRCPDCKTLEGKVKRLEAGLPADGITIEMVREREDARRKDKEAAERITQALTVDERNITGEKNTEDLGKQAWWKTSVSSFFSKKEKKHDEESVPHIEMTSSPHNLSMLTVSTHRVPPNDQPSNNRSSNRSSGTDHQDPFHYDEVLPTLAHLATVDNDVDEVDESGAVIVNGRRGYRDNDTGSFIPFIEPYNGAPDGGVRRPVSRHGPPGVDWAKSLDQHYNNAAYRQQYAAEREAAENGSGDISEAVPEPVEVINPNDPDIHEYRDAAAKATLMQDSDEKEEQRKVALDILNGMNVRGSVRLSKPEGYYDGYMTNWGPLRKPNQTPSRERLPYLPHLNATLRYGGKKKEERGWSKGVKNMKGWFPGF
ncbi:hypothetical protein P154DRAFT_586944 [Amniculicola lignicola CBS 123094]|uniref:Uncharacterized protein n=1 Tax=Amniculicola lignicola CBS 123094 TaxID=1392246 RepID=A0A6A5VYQ7_9PLEO|nr:hypothetical protein P154DRAFT_586944 [Amniculicola lignicola CBS 123094]